ncbi:MAG: TldD/PmbA family protein [Actinobacteria bacterium]|nr:TldD/PmbA family protein [Actinomycetota bacterium]
MEHKLDAGFAIAPEFGSRILRRSLARGGDFAEIFAEDRHSLSMRLEDGKIENVASGTDRGASIRVIRGLSTAFGYVESMDEATLLSLADGLSRTEEGLAAEVLPLAAPLPRPRFWVQKDPALAGAEQKASLLHTIDSIARGASSEVQQVSAAYAENRQRVWIANSNGIAAVDDRTRVMIAVTVTVRRGDLIQTGRETLAHHGGFELFDGDAATALAKQATTRALVMLESIQAPTGRMPVILANGFGGVLFHEACGHGLEADYILKKTSVWEGKKGTQVAPHEVSAYDDAVSPGMWGSGGCDDEGTATQCTTLIEEGVLTGYLSDRLRGTHLQIPLTGNGRRQDFRHLPYPRMTNTYFGVGEQTCEEIIGDTKRALYAKSLSGGEVNPATGDFVFGVAEGYLIENGKIGPSVRGATLIGNGPEVLQKIDAIADDLDVKAGMCGKEGQSVPVGSGQPTLRIRELTVGGTSL